MFEEDPFEGSFVRHSEPDEAVVAVVDLGSGREDDDITLPEFGLHRIADDSDGEGVGIVNIGAADIIIGDAGRVIEVVEVGWVAGIDLVDDGDHLAGRNGNRFFINGQLLFVE